MTILELLRTQDGLITRDQALSTGMTVSAIRHRVTRGDWTYIRPGVCHSLAHPLTLRTRIRADMLWLGPDAVLVGVAAAWWWRLHDEPPRTVRIAIAPNRRVRCRPDLVAERRDVASDDRAVVDGLAVTTRAVSVVDAARELGLAAGAELVDRALLRNRVTVDGLRRAHRRSLGRSGSKTVAILLRLASGGARFEAERRLHRLLRERGIGGWTANHPVRLLGYGDVVLDLAFGAHLVLIEVDGWAYHRDLEAFRRDRRRQNPLVLAGWTVLRVTWHDLMADPERGIAEIETALRGDRRDGSRPVAV